MPSISFRLGKDNLTFELGRKVTKEDLYGRLRKLVVRGSEVLERGYLTPDGRPATATRLTSEALDPEGTPVEEQKVFYDGEERSPLPSSFDEAAELSPARITALAGFCVTDVYPLEGPGLAPGLYATWFSYRKSVERKEAFVQARQGAAFLLVGYSKNCPFVGPVVPYELFDAGDDMDAEDDSEMDFAMM
jgi:hypothetical protein